MRLSRYLGHSTSNPCNYGLIIIRQVHVMNSLKTRASQGGLNRLRLCIYRKTCERVKRKQRTGHETFCLGSTVCLLTWLLGVPDPSRTRLQLIVPYSHPTGITFLHILGVIILVASSFPPACSDFTNLYSATR